MTGAAGQAALAGSERPRIGAVPPRLVPGDTVEVCSPCSPPEAELLDAALDAVRSWGLRVRERPHTRSRHPRFGYLAGEDADRARDLADAITAPDSAAVLCARGGDGAHRTLDRLDPGLLRDAPAKAFVGFSDITALHEALAVDLGAPTLHGPVIGSHYFAHDTAAQEDLKAVLFAPETRTELAPPGAVTLIGGRARGVLAGGNLSLLAGGVGTPHSRPSAAGTLVLLEDINEDVSTLDRYVTQLLRSGWLEGARGVIGGSWGGCTPDDATIRAMLAERLAPLGVPVVDGFGFGHIPAQITVPLGAEAELDTAGTPTLRLDAPALA